MKKKLIDSIIGCEWKQFDSVRNKGGRASCQDDFDTFNIMRRSQFLVYDMELLQSYAIDLINAEKCGRNLIMEKYARMMATTVPQEYIEIVDKLPKISSEHRVCVEEIVKIQVGMMDDFAQAYPNIADNARSIHTESDSEYNTSYETYLRGEMLSYSYESAILYKAMLEKMQDERRNIAKEIMTNTVRLYGYSSLEAAEEKTATYDNYEEGQGCNIN